ncbi:helix-turn-helix transcriptional regulator [Homoserinibacter sp. YIM 151385]|uniref:helix-turn-helix transcriptional regulator n=1 Tax=Homoserinibacter sp. YIM 151385 TaxID=2985506 RepID=UPI0022F0CF45|nr:WYL domain-containing protein [Homoserinibacter sp. YIM 151385]WBU38550.1 WYL domain-containing protein [Homoserinibacter sp. YIM 151385]
MAERQQHLQARDKLAFLLALVPWLVDQHRVSVADAAAHFGMTEKAIREAVELIAVSGVPGDTSSYQHADLFDIAWDAFEDDDEIVITNLVAIDDAPRFSAREAAALLAGLQYLSSLPEYADRAAVDSLMAKLSRGASGLPSQVAVEEAAADASLAPVRDAIARGVQLEFDYLGARGGRERRRVDPLRLESVDADWYLRGWCHLRTALRTFRIDRISELVVVEEPIRHQPSELALPETLFTGAPEDIPVTLELSAAALPLIEDYLPDGAAATPLGERARVDFPISHLGALTRLVAGMPGSARVVEPADARTAVRDWAERALAQYR